jgi:dTDP-glucose pyrophosphorylase
MNSDNWRSCLLPRDSNIGEAIACLDRSGLQIALLTNEHEQLIGTITDGDVRRGLLRGLGLEAPAAEVAQTAPLVMPRDLDHTAVMQMMRANKIHQLPVVTEDRRIVGLQVWDDLESAPERTNWMVVMAGGMGKRLRPLTEDCPKPMLEVGGKPMLEHIVLRARDEGIRKFVFAIGYLGHVIEDHFGDGAALDVEIEYLREKQPLGTGGALSLLENEPEEPFLVTNGDVLTDIRYGDLLDYHSDHRAIATMAVRTFEWQHPFGIVHTDGLAICGFEEKPILRNHVNAGIYVLSPAARDFLEVDQPCDMPTLFDRLRASGRHTIVYPMHEPWMDVGRPDDLQNARDAYCA